MPKKTPEYWIPKEKCEYCKEEHYTNPNLDLLIHVLIHLLLTMESIGDELLLIRERLP